ncbi:hypothetical protein CICLE_v10013801mg [Citrus x clementina]|uniref:Uncharacterized protein n=2 Tax=Citrus TaxID=2706 RepID=A0A067DQK6_CITSI|nr:hypothetical protein CICLE_v10013801mg [Citrus x clementina]KDO45259.1 hypothetical protein CISIN_1g038948mg [Citrus sinensis]GAY43349.1 hypothetical protein CUMW_073820 [Citrus unshiu]
MAGNKQKKSPFSLHSIFKRWKPNRRWEDSYDDAGSTARRIWPSDEDKGGYWVAEPGIDGKASDFIAKFHEARISESERHAVYAAAKG